VIGRPEAVERARPTAATATDGIYAATQPIEIIRPGLHHPHAFFPMLSPEIGAPGIVDFDVRELPLDDVGMPLATLIEEPCSPSL
jgi:hypothetical protein